MKRHNNNDWARRRRRRAHHYQERDRERNRDDDRTWERVYCDHSHKISFLLKREAEAEIARQLAKGGKPGCAYLCPHCWDWHITTRHLTKRPPR